MRPLLILATLVALPLAVAAHRQYFLAVQQGPILARVASALSDPRFDGLKPDGIRVNYLDIILEGRVPDPAAREEAERRVAAISGVRLRPADNHLLVTPRVAAKLEGEKLSLSGWLRDEGITAQAAAWLRKARPGLEVSTAGIRLSSFVARVEPPPADGSGRAVPDVFADAWNAIRTRPTLLVEKKGGAVRASGALPSAALKDEVIAALLGTRAETTLDAAQLRAGAFVKEERFTNEAALPAFLLSFFNSPAPDVFQAADNAVLVRAYATPELVREWLGLLAPLVQEDLLTLDLWMVASNYHLPGYQPESKLAPEALHALRSVLATAAIHFDSGVVTVPSEAKPRLAAAARAIVAAGPEALVVVGAHLDASGDARQNEDAARRRAASVIAELKAAGARAAQLQPAVFSVAPAPDGGDQSRCVELLVR